MTAFAGLWNRLRANVAVSTGLLIGLTAFFGLLGAVPVYINVASAAVFAEIEREAIDADRAPFSYFFDVDADGPRRWDDYREATDVLLDELDVGVDLAHRDVRLSTRRFEVITEPGGAGAGVAEERLAISFSSGRRVGELIDIVDGSPLPASGPASPPVIPVLASAELVEERNLTVGQQLVVVDTQVAVDSPARTTTIELVGSWEASDELDPRWTVRPQFFADDLIMSEGDLVAFLGDDRPPALDRIQWFLLASTEGVGPDRVAEIVARQEEVAALAPRLGPGIGLRLGPDLVLDEFLIRTDDLRATLTGYAAPATVVVILFVVMVVALTAETRRNELAVLRSRGVPLRRTLSSLAIETATVIVAALALTPLVAFGFAALMIRTRAFLDIDLGRAAPGFWQFGALPLGTVGVAALAVLVAQLVALVGPARTTIVARRARRGRLAAAATGLWSRADLFLIVAVVAAIVSSVGSGLGDDLGADAEAAWLDDPRIVIIPAGLGLVAGLVLRRLLPPVMAAVAWSLERTPSTALYLAARRASRATNSFRWPLLLVVVATSLAAFLASLSLSIERQLVDETYLAVGADHAATQFVRPGVSLATAEDYLDVPEVAAATTTLELSGAFGDPRGEPIHIIAIDVTSYGDAAHWQTWYDDQPLGELLSALGAAPDHVVVSDSLLEATGARVGDRIDYAAGAGFTPDFRTRFLTTSATVAAATEHFPRWVGADREPLIVANLDFLTAQAEFTSTTTLLRLREPGSVVGPPIRARDSSAGARLGEVRDRPERQGVFGVLTASFLASTALAGLALVLHSVFVHRERSVEVGILRAGGLRSTELGTLIGFDAIATGAVGVLVGAATGVAASRWLVADVIETIDATVPAAARIAWTPTLVVAGAFVATLVAIAAVTTPLLSRLRVFQAIKLGEQL